MFSKKFNLILIISLLFLINFVNAEIFEENGKYYVEQKLETGWNLIAGISFSDFHENSEVIPEEIFSSYYYDSKNKKDVEIRPIYEAGDINPLVLYGNAFWINSIKNKTIIYKVSPSFISNNNLEKGYKFYSGKNLIAINNEMYGKTINELKGDCNLKKAYTWDLNIQDWKIIGLEDRLDYESRGSLTGKGINIDVENDCEFMKGFSITLSSGSSGSNSGGNGGGDSSNGDSSSNSVSNNLNLNQNKDTNPSNESDKETPEEIKKENIKKAIIYFFTIVFVLSILIIIIIILLLKTHKKNSITP